MKKVSLSMLAIACFCIKTLYGVSDIYYSEIIDNLFLVSGIAASILSLFNRKYKLSSLIVITVIGFLTIWSCYINGNFSILITYLSILLVMDQNFENIMKFIFTLQCYFLLIHLLYSLLYIFIPSYIHVFYEDRICFGIAHPNIFSMIFSATVIEWLWIKKENIKLINNVIITILFIGVYWATRTDALPIIWMILEVYIMINGKLINKIYQVVAAIGFPLSCVITIVFGWLYMHGSPSIRNIIYLLDNILSRRIAMISFASTLNPISLFARKIVHYTGEYNFEYGLSGFNLDNVYCSLIFNYGLLYVVIISVAFFLLARKNDIKINLLITVFVAYGLIESQILLVYNMPTLLLVSSLLENKKGDSVRNNDLYQVVKKEGEV